MDFDYDLVRTSAHPVLQSAITTPAEQFTNPITTTTMRPSAAPPSIKNLFKIKPKPSPSTTNAPITTIPTIPTIATTKEHATTYIETDAVRTNEVETKTAMPNSKAGVFASDTAIVVELTTPKAETTSPKLEDTTLKVDVPSPKPELPSPVPEITDAETTSPRATINYNLKNETDNQVLLETNLQQDSSNNGGTTVSSTTSANRAYNEVDGKHVEVNVNSTNLANESTTETMIIANLGTSVMPRLDSESVHTNGNSNKISTEIIESNIVTHTTL